MKTLWIQALVNQGKPKVRPIKGDLNPADIGTKILTQQRIEFLKSLLGIREVPSAENDYSIKQVKIAHGSFKTPAKVNKFVAGLVAISASTTQPERSSLRKRLPS